jgi:hypothetical protein
MIEANIQYYLPRTTHGSTLSKMIFSTVCLSLSLSLSLSSPFPLPLSPLSPQSLYLGEGGRERGREGGRYMERRERGREG